MQRYLRRHVARDSGHWVRQFMASCDPVEIAQLMRSSRAALLVFGEMLSGANTGAGRVQAALALP